MANSAQGMPAARVLSHRDTTLQAATCHAVSVATEGLPQGVRVAFLRRATQPPDIAQMLQLRAELYRELALVSCERVARQAVAPLDEIVGQVDRPSGRNRAPASGGLMRWLGFGVGRRRPGVRRPAPGLPPHIVSSPR